MKTCILFPGQGAQSIGMGKDFYDESKKVRELFELASDVTKIDLKALIFEGSEEDLKQTRNTQVSLALVEWAASVCLHDRGIVPVGAAGFSLGEWPALVQAGIVSFEQMIALVGERGRLMDEAGKRSGGSTMAAVMNLEPAAIEKAIKDAGIDDVWVANYNSPVQSVISGTESGMDKAEPAIKAAGAKRVIRLKVSGAFHSPIMKYAYDGFRELLTDVS
ncbi:MAG: ACP S-malonyltransferase, partial [Spirochaetes bacterium]|nr:ACP S-malonyltransferase [Spirochaetota bacterium]